MRIAIGSDHAGFRAEEGGDPRALRAHLGADVAAGLKTLQAAIMAALDNGILERRRKTYEFVLYF